MRTSEHENKSSNKKKKPIIKITKEALRGMPVEMQEHIEAEMSGKRLDKVPGDSGEDSDDIIKKITREFIANRNKKKRQERGHGHVS